MLTLYCFPSSGSAASMYHAWIQPLREHNINVVALEYPGRGSRFGEPFVNSIQALCEDLCSQIEEYLSKSSEFAFFGHSLGGLVSFECTRLIFKKHHRLPTHLFVSSRHSPNNKVASSLSNSSSDSELTATLTQMGGLPIDILANCELMELLLPIIRSDLNLNEQYENVDPSKIAVPITAVYGDIDPVVDRDKIQQWREFTQSDFKLLEMRGDHFYFHSDLKQLLPSLISVFESSSNLL